MSVKIAQVIPKRWPYIYRSRRYRLWNPNPRVDIDRPCYIWKAYLPGMSLKERAGVRCMISSVLGRLSSMVHHSRFQESPREPVVGVFDLVRPCRSMWLKSAMTKLVGPWLISCGVLMIMMMSEAHRTDLEYMGLSSSWWGPTRWSVGPAQA